MIICLALFPLLATPASAPAHSRDNRWAILPVTTSPAISPDVADQATGLIRAEMEKQSTSFRPSIKMIPGSEVDRLLLPIQGLKGTARFEAWDHFRAALYPCRLVTGKLTRTMDENLRDSRLHLELMVFAGRAINFGFSISTVKGDADLAGPLKVAISRALREVKRRPNLIGTVVTTMVEIEEIDKGSQDGFRVGQRVTILHGSNEVTAGSVIVVNQHRSTVRVDRLFHPVTPGDKVIVMYEPPGGTRWLSDPDTAPTR